MFCNEVVLYNLEHRLLLLLLHAVLTAANLCSERALGSQPVPQDCRAYVVCWMSVPYLSTCPGEQLYDVQTNSCQPAQISMCCNITFPTTAALPILPPLTPNIPTKTPISTTRGILPPIPTTRSSLPPFITSSNVSSIETVTTAPTTSETITEFLEITSKTTSTKPSTVMEIITTKPPTTLVNDTIMSQLPFTITSKQVVTAATSANIPADVDVFTITEPSTEHEHITTEIPINVTQTAITVLSSSKIPSTSTTVTETITYSLPTRTATSVEIERPFAISTTIPKTTYLNTKTITDKETLTSELPTTTDLPTTFYPTKPAMTTLNESKESITNAPSTGPTDSTIATSPLLIPTEEKYVTAETTLPPITTGKQSTQSNTPNTFETSEASIESEAPTTSIPMKTTEEINKQTSSVTLSEHELKPTKTESSTSTLFITSTVPVLFTSESSLVSTTGLPTSTIAPTPTIISGLTSTDSKNVFTSTDSSQPTIGNLSIITDSISEVTISTLNQEPTVKSKTENTLPTTTTPTLQPMTETTLLPDSTTTEVIHTITNSKPISIISKPITSTDSTIQTDLTTRHMTATEEYISVTSEYITKVDSVTQDVITTTSHLTTKLPFPDTKSTTSTSLEPDVTITENTTPNMETISTSLKPITQSQKYITINRAASSQVTLPPFSTTESVIITDTNVQSTFKTTTSSDKETTANRKTTEPISTTFQSTVTTEPSHIIKPTLSPVVTENVLLPISTTLEPITRTSTIPSKITEYTTPYVNSDNSSLLTTKETIPTTSITTIADMTKTYETTSASEMVDRTKITTEQIVLSTQIINSTTNDVTVPNIPTSQMTIRTTRNPSTIDINITTKTISLTELIDPNTSELVTTTLEPHGTKSVITEIPTTMPHSTYIDVNTSNEPGVTPIVEYKTNTMSSSFATPEITSDNTVPTSTATIMTNMISSETPNLTLPPATIKELIDTTLKPTTITTNQTPNTNAEATPTLYTKTSLIPCRRTNVTTATTLPNSTNIDNNTSNKPDVTSTVEYTTNTMTSSFTYTKTAPEISDPTTTTATNMNSLEKTILTLPPSTIKELTDTTLKPFSITTTQTLNTDIEENPTAITTASSAPTFSTPYSYAPTAMKSTVTTTDTNFETKTITTHVPVVSFPSATTSLPELTETTTQSAQSSSPNSPTTLTTSPILSSSLTPSKTLHPLPTTTKSTQSSPIAVTLPSLLPFTSQNTSKITSLLPKPTLPPAPSTVYIAPCFTSPKPDTPRPTRKPLPVPMCRANDKFIYPDLNSCNFYHECLDGSIRKMKCKYGYQFNPRALKCMPRIEANCRVLSSGAQNAFYKQFLQLFNLEDDE